MNQPMLWQDEPNTAPVLVCAYGEPWLGPHPRCNARGMELAREFAAAVSRGEFDAQGYTPAERTAKTKREAK